MRAFVPEFLVGKARSGQACGHVFGSVMIIDIPGFTSLTEAFIEKGASGAEELSGVLNSLLEPAVEGILSAGGFVGGFAGDSVSGVFPEMDPATAHATALKISELLRSRNGAGPGSLAKVGIARGRTDWFIIPGRTRLFHYIGGRAPSSAAAAQEACAAGEIRIFEGEQIDTPGDEDFRYQLLVPLDAGSVFIPERVAILESPGEFRYVTSLFVSSGKEDGHTLDPYFIRTILDLSEQYDGYLSGVDIKPGGTNALVLFGAPVSHEDDVHRADRFLRDLFDATDWCVRAGVESGPVFAGLLGPTGQSAYTAIGASVNLAARLMYESAWGGVLSGPAFAAKSSLQRIGNLSVKVKGLHSEISAAHLHPSGLSEEGVLFTGSFLGRKHELETLEELVRGSDPEGRKAVVITGEAGTGKSRLINEIESSITAVRFLHLQSDGVQRKSFNPFSRFLHDFFSLRDQAGQEQNRTSFEGGIKDLCGSAARSAEKVEDIATLRRVAPALGSLLGLRWPDSIFEKLDPKLRFDNILEALRSFFSILTTGRRSVLVLDDAHWLDPDSRKSLDLIFQDLDSKPVSWIVLSRQDGEENLPGFARDPDRSVQMQLSTFDRQITAELVGQELGREPSSDLTDFIHGQTGGNPLFVEQYCRFLQERSLLSESDGKMKISTPVTDLPTGLSSLLIARLDSLAAQVRSTVQAASVLGREFEIAVLSGMLKGEDIRPSLRRGVEDRIWQTVNELVLIFRHALLRDAAYSMQLSSRLRELHALAASSIITVHADDPVYYDDLAFHYEKAEMRSEAVSYLRLAARQASRTFLNSRALDLYSRLIPLSEEGLMKAGAMFDRAEVGWNSGMWKEALPHLRETVDYCRAHGLFGLGAKALQRTGRILLETGEEESGLKCLDSAEELLDQVDDLSVRSQILMARAYNMLQSSERSGLEDLLERGLECARSSGDEEQCLRATGSLGNYHLEVGNFTEALGCYEEVAAGAERLCNLLLKAVSLGNLALTCKYLGDDERAIVLFREQLDLAQETGNRYHAILALGNLGSQLARSWSWQEAPDYLRRAIALAMDMKAAQHEGIARVNLSDHCRRLGLVDEALENSTEAVRLCREKGLDYYLGSFLMVHADALLLADRPEEALAAVEESVNLPVMEGSPLPVLIRRAVAAVLLGREREAAPLLAEVFESGELEFSAEASWLCWRLAGSEEDRGRAVALNNQWMDEGKYPWLAAMRLRSMGEDVSTLPPIPEMLGDPLGTREKYSLPSPPG